MVEKPIQLFAFTFFLEWWCAKNKVFERKRGCELAAPVARRNRMARSLVGIAYTSKVQKTI
jgi:hypothetical protein